MLYQQIEWNWINAGRIREIFMLNIVYVKTFDLYKMYNYAQLAIS